MRGRKLNIVEGTEQKTLYEQAIMLTENRDEAHDLVQEAMRKASFFYNNFQEGTNLSRWLSIIMKNTFIDRHRSLIEKPTIKGETLAGIHH